MQLVAVLDGWFRFEVAEERWACAVRKKTAAAGARKRSMLALSELTVRLQGAVVLKHGATVDEPLAGSGNAHGLLHLGFEFADGSCDGLKKVDERRGGQSSRFVTRVREASLPVSSV